MDQKKKKYILCANSREEKKFWMEKIMEYHSNQHELRQVQAGKRKSAPIQQKLSPVNNLNEEEAKKLDEAEEDSNVVLHRCRSRR